ncbi:hypothetical protein [Azospirillum sp. Marseille-Q6669]
MVCRVHGPRFNPSASSVDSEFWPISPREFETFDAAVIFVMEFAPSHDLDQVEIHTDGGELHAILAIARRYRELVNL